MSTGGSYLNSNVSLISKASIRYEGTLYSINPQEATITLSNVKSYGTEDRKADKYLAPKDTLFEYIIFKANDIMELIVDEPLNDPAIVTATQMPSSSGNNAFAGFGDNQKQNVQSNDLTSDAQNTLNGIGGGNAQASAQSVSSAGQAGDRFRSRGSTPASSQARSPVSELSSNNKQRTDLNKLLSSDQNNKNNANQQQNNRLNNNNQQQQQRRGWNNFSGNNTNNNANNNQRRYNNNNNTNNNQMNRRPGGSGYQAQNHYHSNYRQQGGYRRNDDRMSNHLNNNRNGLRTNQPFNRGGNMMRGGPGRKFIPQSNKKFDATLKTEFDFEKANEVFQQMVDKLDDLNLSLNGEKSEKSGSEDKDEQSSKTDLTRNAEKVDKDEDGNFYDKAKSFFDNISCEAIERTKGPQKRFDWKQERKLNAETFGLKVTYRPNNGFRRPIGGGFINRNHNQNYHRRFNNGNNTQPQTHSSGQSRTATSS